MGIEIDIYKQDDKTQKNERQQGRQHGTVLAMLEEKKGKRFFLQVSL